MVGTSLKRCDTFVVTSFVLLASFDLFRAYIEVPAINYIFAFKEVLLICLLFIQCRINSVKITPSFLAVMLLTIFYCGINVVDENGIFLSLIFLKYVLVYFTTYLIFRNLSLDILRKGTKTVLFVFFVYSVTSLFYAFAFPDSMVRAGRMSGSANPSFLSYIYLLCFLYTFFNNHKFWSVWFILVGFLTLTKTFFVACCIVLIYLLIFSSYRGRILLTMLVIVPILSYVLTLNNDVYITYNKALAVLIDRDSNEYNSMDDRIGRIATFERKNSGNFIWGYGTGKAGASTTFLREKIGIELDNLTDFENQILNIFYSLGIFGILLLYYPFVNHLVAIRRKKMFFREKHCFYLFLIVFVLYNLTLNILESFTSCIITLLFLMEYGKEIENRN